MRFLRDDQKLNEGGREWIRLDNENVLKFYGIVYDMGFLPAIITPYCENGNVLEYLNKSDFRLNVTQILILVSICKPLYFLIDQFFCRY